MRRGRLRAATAVAVVASLLAGCSLLGPRGQTLTISTDPPGAQVFVNGVAVGTAPLRHRVRRREEVLLEVRKPGYETAYHTTHRTLSTLGIIDVAGGAVIFLPFLGLLSGAAWKHDPAVVGISLEPITAFRSE